MSVCNQGGRPKAERAPLTLAERRTAADCRIFESWLWLSNKNVDLMVRELKLWLFPRWDSPTVLSVQGADGVVYDRFSQDPPIWFVNRPRMMALKWLARKIATGRANPGPENFLGWTQLNRNVRLH